MPTDVETYALILAALITGAAVGASLGFVGAGGSILAVPILIYVLAVPIHDAIPLSLVVVGLTAFSGVIASYRHGVVAFRIGTLMALAGVLGAVPGLYLHQRIDAPMLVRLFGAVMIVAAAVMAHRAWSGSADGARRPSPTFRQKFTRSVIAGVAIGALTALLGVGGGFIIVPVLRSALRLTMHVAVATSLWVIALNCAVSLGGHIAIDGAIEVPMQGAVFAVAAVISGYAFARLGRTTPARTLQLAFASLTAIVGLGLIVF